VLLDAGAQLLFGQGLALGGAVGGLGGGHVVVEHLVDGLSVGVGLVFDALALGVPVLGQALLARAEFGALPVSAAGDLNLGLAAFGEVVEAKLASYFHVGVKRDDNSSRAAAPVPTRLLSHVMVRCTGVVPSLAMRSRRNWPVIFIII
jgi:hypothetical protein